MTIVTGIPGLEAEVRVNGLRAMEYTNEVKEDSTKTTIRYIESVSGAKFSVHSTCTETFNHSKNDILMAVHVDGQKIGSRFFTNAVARVKRSLINVSIPGMKYRQNKESKIKPLIFSNVDIGICVHSPNVLSTFFFSSVSSTAKYSLCSSADENDSGFAGDQSEKKLRSLGEIRLLFYEGRKRGLQNFPSRPRLLETPDKVPEKALKGRAISHLVR